MIKLEDCGKELLLTFLGYNGSTYQTDVKPTMIIKAPTGIITLFGRDTNSQCEAIKAFMEGYNDKT